MYGSRRRPGKTAEGFIAILCKHSKSLLELICQSLRASVPEIAGRHWTVEGWLIFAADGTRVECPMTQANEKAFGCAGKGKTTPQQFLTRLRQAVRDRYRRTSSKKARHWPHKKTQKPPGVPKMRMASREERAAAQAFEPFQAAA